MVMSVSSLSNASFNVANNLFNKGLHFVGKSPKSLIVGLASIGLLTARYRNLFSVSIIAKKTSNELSSQVTYLYKKALEFAANQGNVRAASKLYSFERIETLQAIPNKTTSPVGSDWTNVGNILEYLIGSEEDGVEEDERLLKELCDAMNFIPNEKLSASVEILEKVIESLKDKNKISELITFCSK
jgi:hypothetical protein